MDKCAYYGCKGEATKEIQTKVNIVEGEGDDAQDSYNTILHVCERCYDEYLEAMK